MHSRKLIGDRRGNPPFAGDGQNVLGAASRLAIHDPYDMAHGCPIRMQWSNPGKLSEQPMVDGAWHTSDAPRGRRIRLLERAPPHDDLRNPAGGDGPLQEALVLVLRLTAGRFEFDCEQPEAAVF